KDTLYFSDKQTHTETYAFKSDQIYGVLRESSKGGCLLDITEDGDPTHEIYFSYKDVTYMGSGKLMTISVYCFKTEKGSTRAFRKSTVRTNAYRSKRCWQALALPMSPGSRAFHRRLCHALFN